jgi:hypothetical protein
VIDGKLQDNLQRSSADIATLLVKARLCVLEQLDSTGGREQSCGTYWGEWLGRGACWAFLGEASQWRLRGKAIGTATINRPVIGDAILVIRDDGPAH